MNDTDGKPAFNVVWSHLAANSHGFEGRGLGIAFYGTHGTLVAAEVTFLPEEGYGQPAKCLILERPSRRPTALRPKACWDTMP